MERIVRVLKPLDTRKPPFLSFHGREYVDFSSNDYLGLSNHPQLINAVKLAAEEFGVSSSASRLLSGDFKLFHQLETRVAQFKGKESALVFNSGYQANVGILSALVGRQDAVFLDKLAHASLVDGALLSGAKLFRFQHNDVTHLSILLKNQRSKFNQALIVTESVFSMDGDKALLKEIASIKEKFNCSLFVDEAHATGIFGVSGSGVVSTLGLETKVEYIMGTFSKALGSFGAYLACSQETKDFLVNNCRSFIYTTALPALVVAANICAIDLVCNEGFRRETLLDNADY
ncbi:MAG: 8-amino-7-oxononanoate synthase, partial [Pseudomonadota bacterium]